MNCHTDIAPTLAADMGEMATLVLAGQPNVGKSVLFARLTGRYATVSNYPGTTVEVSRGETQIADRRLTVLDAPGINSLQPLTEDERVTRRLLLAGGVQRVVQVGDAKNLARTLALSLQLAELDVPLVLGLNMADEAERLGIQIDFARLEEALGVEVVPTVATRGEGVERLRSSIEAARKPLARVDYGDALERAVEQVEGLLPPEQEGKRGLALMLLAGDGEVEQMAGLGTEARAEVVRLRHEAQTTHMRPIARVITERRWAAVGRLVGEVYRKDAHRKGLVGERVAHFCMHPVGGWLALALVLYAVYKLVGEFGAGTLVDLVEGTVLGEWAVPALRTIFEGLVPLPVVIDFLFGEYGVVSVGLVYGLGIVLPIVSTFFLAFGVIEDSGYLPRLAVMVNRAFRVMGLNGKAVLPMVLGLGCVTMATMTTRILSTRKERVIAMLLLALSIPCSAQLGVVLALVGQLDAPAVAVWGAVVVGVMLGVGWLAARVVPGERSELVLEMPPMRMPHLGNIALKTLARVEWYLKEVVPIFVVATIALFVLDKIGALQHIEAAMSPLVVGWLGLPGEAAGIFLMGFLRRDYGAAGLFALAAQGLLSPHQVLVSLVVITLFIPCIATVMMIAKEQGWKRATGIVLFVFPFAFLVGGLVNLLHG